MLLLVGPVRWASWTTLLSLWQMWWTSTNPMWSTIQNLKVGPDSTCKTTDYCKQLSLKAYLNISTDKLQFHILFIFFAILTFQKLLLDEPNDFIDSYLAKIEESPKESSFHGTLGLQNLRSTILDLLLAGSETTSTALTWAILYMIRYPEIQKRVQRELDQVVGSSRLPRVEDR